MKVSARVKIPEAYFSWENIMQRKTEEIPKSTVNLAEFFKGIAVTSSPIKRPESDTMQVLDFQIETNDGFAIWCHKVLISRNHCFYKV